MNLKLFIISLLVLPFSSKSQQVIYDSFENWIEVGDMLKPSDWEVWPEIDLEYNNILRESALTDGDYAIKLTSNIPFWEGNETQSIWRSDMGNYSNISIQMSYKCYGEGDCVIFGYDNSSSYYTYFFSQEAGVDTTTHTFSINNISPSVVSDYFYLFNIEARPIAAGNGFWGVCNFIIDDLQINFEMLNVGLEENSTENDFTIYPNPATNKINIETSINESIELYTTLGKLIKRYQVVDLVTPIDVSDLPKGFYILKQNKQSKRFVKQ